MKIHFSRHAKRQMKWREILEGEVRAAILQPEKTEDSTKGRKNSFRRLGKKLLKVTYKEESDRIVIVTVVDRNR